MTSKPDIVVTPGIDGTTGTGLRTAASSGVRWSLVALVGRQVGRLAVALLLARLLGPASFGVIAAASIYLAFTSLFLEAGFGTLIIQKRALVSRDVAAVLVLSVSAACAVALLTLALAPVMARVMNTPELTEVLRFLTLGLVLKGIAVVPASLLNRTLSFRALALAELTATLVGGAAGLTAAALGASYWSLVYQQLTTDVLFLALLLFSAGVPRVRTDLAHVAAASRFGGRVLTSQIIGYLARNSDSVIIGAYLGPVALALYMVAYRVMLLPVFVLGSVANRVGFSVFSRLQHDVPEARRYFLRITEAMCFLVFPVMLLLAVNGREVVLVLFGEAWLGATHSLQVLAVNGAIQCLVTAGGAVFLGFGRTDLVLRWSWLPTVISILSFFVGLPWGILGVATAYTVTTCVLTIPMMRAIGRIAGFTLRDWWSSVVPALAAAVAACFTAEAVRIALLTRLTSAPLAVLCASGAVGLGTYLLTFRLVWPRQLRRGFQAVLELLPGLGSKTSSA